MRTETTTHNGHLTGYGTRPYRSYVLVILLLVYTLNFIDRQLVGVLSESIILDFGLTDFEYSLLAGLPFAAFYAIMGVPLALAADRYNRVYLMVACIVLWSVMTALCGISIGFWTLLVFRIGVAIGEAGCTPPANSIISDYFKPSSRATAIGVYSMGVTLGSVLAFLFGGILAGMKGETFGAGLTNMGLGFIAQHFDWVNIPGWRIAFVVIGLPGVLVGLLMYVTVKEPPRGYSDAPDTEKPKRASFMETMMLLFKKPSFWWNAIAASCVAFVGYGLFSFQTSFLVRAHGHNLPDLSVPEQIRYFSIYFGATLAFVSAIGTFLGGYLTDKMSKRSLEAVAWIPASGLIISIPFYIAALFATELHLIWIFFAIGSTCHYTYLGAQFNIAQGIVPAHMRATSIAILLIVVSLVGNGLGPTFVGAMSDILTSSGLTDGLTLGVCSANDGLSVEQLTQCAQARAEGLRNSMALAVTGFALGGLSFLMLCRYLSEDWVAGRPDDPAAT